MGENSSIQWTDATFNPWIGCAKVSPGCTHCYAEVGPAAKFKGVEWGTGKPRVRTADSNWAQPRKWDRASARDGVRRRVFCASLSDWLDPEVPVDWLAALLDLIAETPNLDWLLLSKRPEYWRHRVDLAGNHASKSGRKLSWDWLRGTAPSNVWVGTTVEDQRRADERIPALLSIPARVRFLSMEPLLEAVSVPAHAFYRYKSLVSGLKYANQQAAGDCATLPGIDWVICGGESGPRARPFNVAWARSILRQCKEAGVACFIKQLGALPLVSVLECGGMSALEAYSYDHLRVRLSDSHGGDPSEWPADLRVREFPGGQP